ncbi:hypothetical protein CCUS01_03749 [Colletotrichum cuscutae]|uniref:Uncharacterized protein n=1 Tax=Colletotrichum cuscutae TaxID=1209917 RepID=A0AAI9VFG5_9PEZI|nr:hypothetical protein CCUS01_03749 [Colletotrichum cuscutae]
MQVHIHTALHLTAHLSKYDVLVHARPLPFEAANGQRALKQQVRSSRALPLPPPSFLVRPINAPTVCSCLFCLPFVIATALSSEGFPLPERLPPTRKSGRRALLPPHTLPYRSQYRHRARPGEERYPTLAHIRRRERTTRGYLTSISIPSSSDQSPQGKKRCGVSSRQLQFDNSEPHISIPSPGPRPSTRRGLDPNRTPFHHHNSFPLTTHLTGRNEIQPISFLLHPSNNLTTTGRP